MAFEKGKSGNPGGRPRKTDEQIRFETKCREWADLFALDKLKKAADSSKAAEIIAAVKEICDRGFGRPETVSYIDANVTAPTGRSAQELAGDIADLIGKRPTASGEVHSGDSVDGGK